MIWSRIASRCWKRGATVWNSAVAVCSGVRERVHGSRCAVVADLGELGGVLGAVQRRRAGEGSAVGEGSSSGSTNPSHVPTIGANAGGVGRHSPGSSGVVLRLGHRGVDAVVGAPGDQRGCRVLADADPVHLADAVRDSASAAS